MEENDIHYFCAGDIKTLCGPTSARDPTPAEYPVQLYIAVHLDDNDNATKLERKYVKCDLKVRTISYPMCTLRAQLS